MRFQILSTAKPPANLTITETVVAPLSTEVVSVLLDIDAFVQGLDETAGTAWQIIERPRHEKNFAFESSITDATRKLIL